MLIRLSHEIILRDDNAARDSVADDSFDVVGGTSWRQGRPCVPEAEPIRLVTLSGHSVMSSLELERGSALTSSTSSSYDS